MTIGIIGAGAIGMAIATLLDRHDLPATMAARRGPETLGPALAGFANLRPGTVAEAARQDIVFVAVPWACLTEALVGLPDFAGRIVVDANNPVIPPFVAADLGGRPSSAVFKELVPGARLVKGFNTLPPEKLTTAPAAGRRVLFLAGDDAAATAEIAQLVEQLGLAAIDLGPIEAGGRLTQFPGGVLAGLDLSLHHH